jgi:hypothetical protein
VTAMPISVASRARLIRALTRDEHARETLIGLTFAETEWYRAYQAKEAWRGDGGSSNGESPEEAYQATCRYLELHAKHELARMRMIAAEAEARLVSQKN